MASQHLIKRRRTTKACISCRRLKKKCDGEEPCSYCARFHHTCQYDSQNTTESPFNTTSSTPVGNGNNGRPVVDDRTIIPTLNQEGGTHTEHSILDPEKGRYFDASSAVAFPRLLGIELGATKAPRLHSFAWNLGLRSESPLKLADITKLVSLNDVHIYATEYFTFIHPVFDILDEREFRRRVSLRWKASGEDGREYHDMIICGVVALGSLCSHKSDTDTETALVAAAKDSLESAGLTRPPGIDLVAAWILRAIYLRMVSRPHASWMASNIIMHLIQASGISRELSTVAIIYPSSIGALLTDSQALYRRKIFWVGRALHSIFSYEYSRPRIIIDNITIADIESEVGSMTRDFLRLAELLPINTQSCRDDADVLETKSVLKSLATSPLTSIPLSLFAADIAFAAYRHLRPYITSVTPISDPIVSQVLSVGTIALSAIIDRISDQLHNTTPGSTSTGAPWWSLISTPFHFVLILISIDTSESLAALPFALQVLRQVATVYDSHLTREAVHNATMLVHLSRSQKEGDIQYLRQALGQYDGNHRPSSLAVLSSSHQAWRDSAATAASETVIGNERQTNNSIETSLPTSRFPENPREGTNLDDLVNTYNNGVEADGLNASWEELCQYLDWT